MTSVMAQLLVPFAATLAPEADRGRVVGNVMSGLILGILLARTFSGLVAQVAGWRTVYVIAAVLMLAQTVAAVRQAAALSASSAGLTYPKLLASVLRHRARRAGAAPARALRRLLVRHVQRALDDARLPAGRLRPTGTATASSASSASWARPARSPPRSSAASPTAAGSTGSPAAAAGSCSLGFVFLWLGRASLPPLIVGIVLLDIGSQGVHISNQSEIYRLRPEARNRINAFYMTSCFVGAAAGSAAAAFAYDRWGWAGTCALGGLVSARRGRPLGDRPAAAPAPRRNSFREAPPPA